MSLRTPVQAPPETVWRGNAAFQGSLIKPFGLVLADLRKKVVSGHEPGEKG
jgi:hypothetical protein